MLEQVHERALAPPPSNLLHTLSGVRATRVIDGRHAHVLAHSHDWPVLSLFVIGGYVNRSTVGERRISVPSAVFYRAGESHENFVGPKGFEQIEIEFDPRWLQDTSLHNLACPVAHWVGGEVGAATRRLAAAWRNRHARESDLLRATRAFLKLATHSSGTKSPRWLDTVEDRINTIRPPSTSELARELDLNASWLASAYRACTGEGLAETVARRRVEAAVDELRTTDSPAAEVAIHSGFCDQSHMIRAFKKFVGRSPSQIRRERHTLRVSAG